MSQPMNKLFFNVATLNQLINMDDQEAILFYRLCVSKLGLNRHSICEYNFRHILEAILMDDPVIAESMALVKPLVKIELPLTPDEEEVSSNFT